MNTYNLKENQVKKLQQLNDIKYIKKDEQEIKSYKKQTFKLMIKLSSIIGIIFSIIQNDIILLPLTISSGLLVIIIISMVQKLILNIKKNDFKVKYNNDSYKSYTLNETIKEIRKTKTIIKNSTKYECNVLNNKQIIENLKQIRNELLNDYNYSINNETKKYIKEKLG